MSKMLDRIRHGLTYGNVASTLALVVALGGTSYAAFSLPRNSVGHRQLQAGAVRGREVKNHSLGTADISSAVRRILRGSRGPQGHVGPAGPAGSSAIEYFAALTGSGERVAGNATGNGRDGAIGLYHVTFSRSVSGCAASATLGTTDTSTAPAGRITVSVNADGSLGVHTYDEAGSAADEPFHVLVAC
jgi:hypothetical protein